MAEAESLLSGARIFSLRCLKKTGNRLGAFRCDERNRGSARSEYRQLYLDMTGSWHWLF
ncbi:hypothetical protein PO124_11930 [Bacillus licheniformis]|nr:hypothetical protein [Bacillus licheniformis]